MNEDPATMEAVIQAIRTTVRDEEIFIGPTTNLLADVDLDSLQMLELIGHLKERFGTDFLDPGHSIEELRTPETIVATVRKENLLKSQARK